MDSITGISRTSRKPDSFMVVVDMLRKVAHIILVKNTHSTSEVAQVFIREIMIFHGVPKNIVSEKDAKFTGCLQD